jgi:hypothetical protein
MVLPRQARRRRQGTIGAAAIAVAAARRVLLSEVPSEEHAAAFLGLGVIGDGAKPTLALVTKCLEFRHDIAGAGSEGLQRHRDFDAVLLIALDQAGLLKIRQ